MSLDVDRLVKVLAMTTSDHDGEALAAIRKANAILKEQGLTWAEFVRQHTPYYQNPGRNPFSSSMSEGFATRGTYQQYERPQRYGFYDEEAEAMARARGEQQRQQREARQAERDKYAADFTPPGRDRPFADDWDTIWDEAKAQDDWVRLRTDMAQSGVEPSAILNFGLFRAKHPDVGDWLWKHRDDDVITKLSWQGVTSFPMRMGPLHLSILRRMMAMRA